MIDIETIKNDENFSHSTIITYPRTTQISHGVYDNKVDMMNMITMIKNNVVERCVTNVQGGKTEWDFFNDKPEYQRFLDYIVQKHQNSNPIFCKENWYLNIPRIQAWGNELRKGEYVNMHQHYCYHVILYLTEGSPLEIPELKIKINPKVGSYYIMEPYIFHGVSAHQDDNPRYNLVINIEEVPDWGKHKDVAEIEQKK